VVFTIAVGTRYLLLLLPTNFHQLIDAAVQITLVESPFSKALTEGLISSHGPPFPFNLAYLNSINSWPRFMAIQAGPSTLAIIALSLGTLLGSYLWIICRGRGVSDNLHLGKRE
jgi:hypothetical protein